MVRPQSAVEIAVGKVQLAGELMLPRAATGLVVFAHGSGSSRHSPRNVLVARMLSDAGIGTLLFDLLTPSEDREYSTRFDIPLLGARLKAATEWLWRAGGVPDVPTGFFGASTGAAAALVAAAELGQRIAAVVSRGGRPDLAGETVLHRVAAPTLLIVGGADREVIALNRAAFASLHCEKSLQIVPGATHLFEEPGTLEQVCTLASQWFRRWLRVEDGQLQRHNA
jgi:putative phosphoribosyl transferase